MIWTRGRNCFWKCPPAGTGTQIYFASFWGQVIPCRGRDYKSSLALRYLKKRRAALGELQLSRKSHRISRELGDSVRYPGEFMWTEEESPRLRQYNSEASRKERGWFGCTNRQCQHRWSSNCVISRRYAGATYLQHCSPWPKRSLSLAFFLCFYLSIYLSISIYTVYIHMAMPSPKWGKFSQN